MGDDGTQYGPPPQPGLPRRNGVGYGTPPPPGLPRRNQDSAVQKDLAVQKEALTDLQADIESERAAQQAALAKLLQPGRTPPSPPENPASPRFRFRPGYLVLGAIALLIALGAAVAGIVVVFQHHGHSAATAAVVSPPSAPADPAPTGTPQVNAAEAWIRANVMTTTAVLGDPGVVRDLQSSGYQGAAELGPNWRDARYIVLTPTLRSEAVVAPVTAASSPVAIYGSGDLQVQVRALPTGGIAGLAATLTRDAAARHTAGPQLLTNPNVSIDPASAAVLSKGMLDLRAATFVALLASTNHIEVSHVVIDPAEAAAGIPSRALEIKVSDSAAIALTMQRLPAAYRPVSIAGSGTDAVLTWPIAVPPIGTA
jgi:hypothetical protein